MMNWTRIIAAANGRPQSPVWFVRHGIDADVAALATLLLLDDAPRPAAALIAAARMVLGYGVLPTHAALAPHVAPALATWRANPQWANRAIGDDVTKRWFARGVAGMVDALHELPAALRDAVDIVVRDGDSSDVGLCLEALGAPGWSSLDADLRAALLARADPDDLGRVWGALDDAQRTAAAQRATSDPDAAARLIGRIDRAAWRATDPALRERLIDAVARDQYWIPDTAPAWPGMTDDERETLARAAMACDDAVAVCLLESLGAAGRQALTADLRAALEWRAMQRPDAWRVPAWRAADDGWTALSAEERRAVLAAAERNCWDVPWLLRAVGAAGWRAMTADDQARLADVVRRTPDDLFRCPPTLWSAIAGAALPPTHQISWIAIKQWRAEDADADLGGLPPSHQTLVLALAPWRTEDATKDSARLQRLVAAWDALPDDERVAFATERPSVLATVAAAARLAGGAAAARDAAGETVVRVAATTDGAAARRIVGAMLHTSADWRAWMIAFAPTDADPPEVGKAWRRAVRRGLIDDVTLCARLAATPRESRARGALRRA